MSDFDTTASELDGDAGRTAAVADADVRTLLEEVELAAARLRRLPLTKIVPETPYSPNWPEVAS